MMKDVYANSSLNICASAAADSSEASLQLRNGGLLAPLDIEPRWTGLLSGNDDEGKLGPLPSYLHQPKLKLVDANMYKSEVLRPQLATQSTGLGPAGTRFIKAPSLYDVQPVLVGMF